MLFIDDLFIYGVKSTCEIADPPVAIKSRSLYIEIVSLSVFSLPCHFIFFIMMWSPLDILKFPPFKISGPTL